MWIFRPSYRPYLRFFVVLLVFFGSAAHFFLIHFIRLPACFNVKPITCLYVYIYMFFFGRCVSVCCCVSSVGRSVARFVRARLLFVYVPIYVYTCRFIVPCKRSRGTNTSLMVCYHTRWVPYRTLTHIRIRLPMSLASASNT